MNSKSSFILIAIASCAIFNWIAQTGGSPLLLLLGLVTFFFSLYKICILEGENGWLAIFGILNFIGLLIVLLIPRFKAKNHSN